MKQSPMNAMTGAMGMNPQDPSFNTYAVPPPTSFESVAGTDTRATETQQETSAPTEQQTPASTEQSQTQPQESTATPVAAPVEPPPANPPETSTTPMQVETSNAQADDQENAQPTNSTAVATPSGFLV